MVLVFPHDIRFDHDDPLKSPDGRFLSLSSSFVSFHSRGTFPLFSSLCPTPAFFLCCTAICFPVIPPAGFAGLSQSISEGLN
jgi:hypothetical protein